MTNYNNINVMRKKLWIGFFAGLLLMIGAFVHQVLTQAQNSGLWIAIPMGLAVLSLWGLNITESND